MKMTQKKKKSWREKLHDSKDLPKVVKIDGKMSKRWGQGTCLIPAPVDVDAEMKRVGKGKLTTVDALRSCLAAKHNATIACPMTTGIFAWIAAHAAHEAESAGAKRVTPYWRTLKAKGEINPKYPGGAEQAAVRLAAEGHTIEQRGDRYYVVGFERKLARLS
jgi:hypothetical protein